MRTGFKIINGGSTQVKEITFAFLIGTNCKNNQKLNTGIQLVSDLLYTYTKGYLHMFTK